MTTLSPTGDFWMFLDSHTDKIIFPTNKYDKFNCILPLTVVLKQTNEHLWQLAVTDILLRNPQTNHSISLPGGYVILCSIIQSSVIKGRFRPVLRQFFQTGDGGVQQSLFHTQYMPIRATSFNSIAFEILDIDLNDLPQPEEPEPEHSDPEVNCEPWIRKITHPEVSLILHFQAVPRVLPLNL